MAAPDYKTYDPKGFGGDPKRGAALGRPAIHDKEDPTTPIKLYMRQVNLDYGGYDRNGTYFGAGPTIYWYANAEGDVDSTLRAWSRSEAKTQVRLLYPKATFFN